MEQRPAARGSRCPRRVADTFIYAPQDGIIISRDLERGRRWTPGLAIFTLADPTTVWVKLMWTNRSSGGSPPAKRQSSPSARPPASSSPGGWPASAGERPCDRRAGGGRGLHVATETLPPREQSEVYIVTEKERMPFRPRSGPRLTRGKMRGVFVVPRQAQIPGCHGGDRGPAQPRGGAQRPRRERADCPGAPGENGQIQGRD